VLLHYFSEPDDYDVPVVSPAFHNPIPLRSRSGPARRDQAKPNPLPYAYIDELRAMLAKGPCFRDWTWAQATLGAEFGQVGVVASDWFEVAKEGV
jgi:hypothetical protein